MTASADRFWNDDRGVFDDPELIGAIDRRAEADIAAGRTVGFAAVLHWLNRWGGEAPLLPLTWPD